MTDEVFEDLVKQALAALPPKLQRQAAEILIVPMSDPPAHAPKESVVAFVQGPTHLRLEVYKSGFDDGTQQEALDKLKTVLSEEFSFYFES